MKFKLCCLKKVVEPLEYEQPPATTVSTLADSKVPTPHQPDKSDRVIEIHVTPPPESARKLQRTATSILLPGSPDFTTDDSTPQSKQKKKRTPQVFTFQQ